MNAHASTGSPVAHPQLYHTTVTAILTHADQGDRHLKQSELKELTDFFSSGAKRLEIATTITQNAEAIIAAAADRIFFGGAAMSYLEPPANRENLPGYTPFPRLGSKRPQELLQLQPRNFGNPLRWLWNLLQVQLSEGREPLPDGFHLINVYSYGEARMKRSMRDLSWFLRYVTYAIVAGDSSILTVNTQGLRGIIPEDVTEATVVALREMRWRSMRLFKQDETAQAIIKQHFDATITAYIVEKPSLRLRPGFSNQQQGLLLPESYALAAVPQSRFVMKPQLSPSEQAVVVKAAYRQVFERDIGREYSLAVADLESKWKSGELSTKEFMRRLGKSKLYRRECYAPFTISRVIELAVRHFLGRGLNCLEEFQDYFEVITQGGLPALIDALVDSSEYSDYFGEETVPYLRGLGQEAQACRNWSPQLHLFKYSTLAHKVPQFVTAFGEYQKPLPNQHAYGAGHDPLEIQFGAIFPKPSWKAEDLAAPFDRNDRRILVSCHPGQGEFAQPLWGMISGSWRSRILKLEPPVHTNGHANGQVQTHVPYTNVNLFRHSPTAVIQAAYRQVFGREVLSDQRLTAAESKLKDGEISVREFVRQLAKSRLFRSLYWDKLYVTKAVEYIHRRLLGRPTYGRQEMGQYYDICAKKGFYALIDAIVDSKDYISVFGENTVPYERYLTPKGYEMKAHPHRQFTGSSIQDVRAADGQWMKDALHRINHWNGVPSVLVLSQLSLSHAAVTHSGNGDGTVDQVDQQVDQQAVSQAETSATATEVEV
jgi:phycobilisome core-membrane linker protein